MTHCQFNNFAGVTSTKTPTLLHLLTRLKVLNEKNYSSLALINPGHTFSTSLCDWPNSAPINVKMSVIFNVTKRSTAKEGRRLRPLRKVNNSVL